MTARTHSRTSQKSPQGFLTLLWDDEAGQDIVEYALVAAALGLFTVAGVHGVANSVMNDITIVLNRFKAAVGLP